MSRVTLIGDRIARPGSTFVFMGPQPECRECKLKSACLQLDKGGLYEIVKSRDIHHEGGCRYHEDGVRVVEVQAALLLASVKTMLAIKGSIVEYTNLICSNHECENFYRCHPNGLERSMKVRIVDISNTLTCPLGYDLTEVQVERA